MSHSAASKEGAPLSADRSIVSERQTLSISRFMNVRDEQNCRFGREDPPATIRVRLRSSPPAVARILGRERDAPSSMRRWREQRLGPGFERESPTEVHHEKPVAMLVIEEPQRERGAR